MNKEYNIKCLDKYDFSQYLYNGRDFWNIRDAIEKKYDTEFRVMYHIKKHIIIIIINGF